MVIDRKANSVLDDRLSKYILESGVYPQEAPTLKELRHETASHPLGFMSTSPDSGQMMTMLLKIMNARKTMEIGVYTGYSLLLTALALPDDGQITAIDPVRETYEIGLPIIKKAGVEHKIEFIQSKALHVLDNLLQEKGNEGSYDFAFVDADKENYERYHERVIRLVRVGGLILYDNTLWNGTVAISDEAEVPNDHRHFWKCIVEFNARIAGDPRVEICLAPIGDGLTICRRLS